MDYLLIVITNQSGIGRGMYTLDDFYTFTDELAAQTCGTFDDIYVCPHTDEDACECRKPKPNMVLEAAEKWNVDLQNSWFV